MARQYVTYAQVQAGLRREGDTWPTEGDPMFYLNALRRETGLSWAKLAHDISVDSGCKVSEANVRRWAR